ncbi:MAG: zinc-dependent alcohol dehydrogenase [Candidatus Helarchaeota archaeon]
MKAVVLEDVGKLVYKENYPKPILGADDALVRVQYCGICGSDITNFKQGLYKIPLVPGHELAGVVEEVGENVDGFSVEDKVVGINVKLDVTREMRGLGIFQDGGFAEFVKVPKDFLFHAPVDTSFQHSVMVESYALGMRAIKLSGIEEDQRVIIIGGGNVGLTLMSGLLVIKKPKYIGLIEPYDYLRGKAKEMGATETFDLSKAKIRKFLREQGAPMYIFDCAGTEKSFKLAMDLINPGGTIILEGLYRGTVSFPLMMINSKEICIKGVMGHDKQDILAAIELVAQKQVDPSKIISEIVPLQELEKTFHRYLEVGDRNFVKILVKI